jgi:hypothetical protein
MRTLSKLMIAAGFVGTIATTGTTAAVAQGVYLQGPGFGVDIGRPAYYRGYSDYDSPRIYREGDITEVHTRTSVAGVTATGISAPRLT